MVKSFCEAVFRILIRIPSGQWNRIIRDPDPGGQKRPCSLDVLYRGLGLSKLQFLINFFSCNFLKNFAHQTLNPVWIRILIGTQPDPELMNRDRNTV
jgi:hypothetical protein